VLADSRRLLTSPCVVLQPVPTPTLANSGELTPLQSIDMRRLT
jgi:hypothetical protein